MTESDRLNGADGEARRPSGQWMAGVSGNPKGRPRKAAAQLKSLPDLLAEAMTRRIPVINAQGKRETIRAADALVQQLIRSIPDMKPREAITAMQLMHKFGLEAESKAAAAAPHLTAEEARECLKARLKQLRNPEAQ